MAEEDVDQALGGGLAQRHRIAGKGLADAQAAAAVGEPAALLNATHDVSGAIINGWQRIGHAPGAWDVAGGWSLQSQGMVRALEVVDAAPMVESQLHVGQ